MQLVLKLFSLFEIYCMSRNSMEIFDSEVNRISGSAVTEFDSAHRTAHR